MKLKKISYILSSALIMGTLMGASVVANVPVTDFIASSSNVLEDVDLSATGSISIQLSDSSSNSSKVGVKFSVSKIANVINGEYKVLDEYSNIDCDLNELKDANDLELAASLFKDVVKIDITVVTNESGFCKLDNLEVGVYLIYVSDIASYGDNITPFIVSIPSWDEQSKVMSYDIVANPKHTEIPKDEKKAPSTGYDSNAVKNLVTGGICVIVGSALYLKVRKKENN